MQLTDELRVSLTTAGIGKRFHDRKLGEFPEFAAITRALHDGSAQARLKEGTAWTIEGGSGRAREAFMVLARSTHITGTGVLVTDLIDLVDRLNEEQFARQVLFVGGFSEPGPHVLTPYQARQVARTLIEWLEEGGAVVPLVSADMAEWWPAYLVDALCARNTLIQVR